LTLPGKGEVTHTGQRIGMVRSESRLARLYHFYLELLGFVLPALIAIHQPQVAYTAQHVWMVRSEFRLASLYHFTARTDPFPPLTLSAKCVLCRLGSARSMVEARTSSDSEQFILLRGCNG
jgi:hypothetical protein